MEEHMAVLLEKMDHQNKQLQLLTWQQAERVDVIALKQKETEGHIDAIKDCEGNHGWTISAMEKSIAELKSFHAEIGEQPKLLKQELGEKLLQELATLTSLGVTQLQPMAPPLCHQMLLLVWFREKEWEKEILRALEMLLEVDLTVLMSTET